MSKISIPDQTFDLIDYETKREEVYQRTIAEKSYSSGYLEASDAEASLNTELNSAGEFDGVTGLEPDPQKWSAISYRSGFLSGIGRYYDNKYQVCLDNEPF